MQAEAEEVNKDALWGPRWLHLSVISLCEYAECAGGEKHTLTHSHWPLSECEAAAAASMTDAASRQ